tara:strand:- start:2075 stop:2386 length:312 start_codon:yes stop_codon:yes gene_type:complete
MKCSKCGFEYEASVHNQNGLAVGFTITPCCKKDVVMNKHQAKKIQEYTMQNGHKVMRIPINNLQYINIADDVVIRNSVNNRQWWLIIEENGFTWIWDGMIMEG